MNDDMPWVDLTPEEIQELRTNKQQLTEYGKQKIRELMNKSNPITAKVSDEDLEKVMDAAARQELAKKSFEELTKDEKIKLALEELDWIVLGGQDGEEFYNSIQFIRKVLKSLK